MPEIKATNFSGRISEWVWNDEIKINREDSSGSGIQQTIPRRYIIILNEITGIPKNIQNDISNYCLWGYNRDRILSDKLSAGEMRIILEANISAAIKVGAVISFSKYSISAHDSGPHGIRASFSIDGETYVAK
jgi:hypothetical protein